MLGAAGAGAAGECSTGVAASGVGGASAGVGTAGDAAGGVGGALAGAGTAADVVSEVIVVGACDGFGRVAALAEAMVGELAGLSLDGAQRGSLRELVAGLGRVRAGADAAEARVVQALDRLDDGGVDAVEVLRRNTGSSQREARRRSQRAGTLAKMPKVTGALAAGDISPEHADALARAAGATSAEAVDGDAELLAQVAAVPADRAGRHIQEWTQRNQDPADLHEQHLRQRRRRRLNFGDGEDGMLMAHAAFDRVLGAQFRSLINGIADRIWRAEGGRDNPDSRSAEQRRLDALAIAVGLEPAPSQVAQGHGAAGESRQSESGECMEPANDLVVERSGDDGSARRVSRRHQIVVVASADVVTGKDPQGRCEIPGIGPISQSELERLACDAELFGILFSGDGEPLWHGRAERTATDAQWRALVARDGGCVLCAGEPARCEAHHVVPWAKPAHGPTDIDNMALLCNACHRRLHEHKHVLVRGSDGTWGSAPDPRYANRRVSRRNSEVSRLRGPMGDPGRADDAGTSEVSRRRGPMGDPGRADDAGTSAGKSLACHAGPRPITIDVSSWVTSEERVSDRPVTAASTIKSHPGRDATGSVVLALLAHRTAPARAPPPGPEWGRRVLGVGGLGSAGSGGSTGSESSGPRDSGEGVPARGAVAGSGGPGSGGSTDLSAAAVGRGTQAN